MVKRLFVACVIILSSSATYAGENADCEACKTEQTKVERVCCVGVGPRLFARARLPRIYRRPGQVLGYVQTQPITNAVRFSVNAVFPPYPLARVAIGLQVRPSVVFLRCCDCD